MSLCSSHGYSNGWITPSGEWIKQDSKGSSDHFRISSEIVAGDPDLKKLALVHGTLGALLHSGYVKVSNAFEYEVVPPKIHSGLWNKILGVIMSCPTGGRNPNVYVYDATNPGVRKYHVNWPANEITVSILRSGKIERGSDRVAARYMRKLANICGRSDHSNGWVTPSGDWIKLASNGKKEHLYIAMDVLKKNPDLQADFDRQNPRSEDGEFIDYYGPTHEDILMLHGYVRVVNAFNYQAKPDEVNSVQWEKVLDIIMSCSSKEGDMVFLSTHTNRPHVNYPVNEITVDILKRGKVARYY